MEQVKPLFMKTYGRQKRKVSAWISPDNRRKAFDSTDSTDGDMSVFEPKKIRDKKTSVASHRPPRASKKKAALYLTEKSFDEETFPTPPCPQPAQRRKTTIVKKTVVSRGKGLCRAKRKAGVTETSSDEENIWRPSPPRLQPAQQSKTTRKSRLVSVPGVSRQKAEQLPNASESEGDSTSTAKCHKNSVQRQGVSNVHPPSVGRFVTRRRRAITTKPKVSKATLSLLDSSDDFTYGPSRVFQPPKRKPRPLCLVSSAENSVNVAGAASFATSVLREISLNESVDHSLGPCSRRPIFCSTPSAGALNARPRLKPSFITNQSSSPPSMLGSCIEVLSTFQADVDSPQQSVSPGSAPPVGFTSERDPHSSLGKQEPDLHHHEDASGDLLTEGVNKSGCSEEAKSHSENIKTTSVGEVPSLNLFTTDDSDSSSRFVSAAGGLEWLIEALKEKCLTERCTVQLERLDSLTMTQLCGQTTYSSCLGLSSCRSDEDPVCVDSVQTFDLSQSAEASSNLHLSATENKSQSVNSLEASVFAASEADSRSTKDSPSVDCKRSASVLYADSAHCIDSSVEFVMATQLPTNSPEQPLFTEGEAAAAKSRCLTKKCRVQLKQLALSQVSDQQLKGFTNQRDCTDPDVKQSENDHTRDGDDPEDFTCSGETGERTISSVRQSGSDSSPAAQKESDGRETEEETAALKTMLKEKCLTGNFSVVLKKLTLSQLKETLQLKDVKLQSATDLSDSSGDGQTKYLQRSERGAKHPDEKTSAVKVSVRKRGSTSSDDKEGDVKNRRKKTSLAPREKKRRSASTDRPGTSRKACVSGLSVSRWKNKASSSTHVFGSRAAQTGGSKAVDCSIDELISTQDRQTKELSGTATSFSTPVKANRLNLSSLLADFTPNTHTWSRLKAALSVHRKGMVFLTPKSLRLSVSGTPGKADHVDISQDLFATPLRTPLPKHLRSQLLSHDSLAACEDADLSDAEKVYAECGQQRPLPWQGCILPQRMKRCVKIGEGTFGEVFSTTNASGDTVALKIIPVEGSEKVNGEDQKTFGEILHEIIISKELSSLKEKQQNQTHGFIGLIDLHCVQGRYPPDLLKAWDAFDRQKGSENDRPDFFDKDQLFIILEFEFGGVDLENSSGTLASLAAAKSILHQVTAALAVAEQELHFEHRDLHWGNVLVKTTKQKTGSFLLNGAAHSLETKGVLVRIIDYSLSRLEIDDLTVSCDISKDEELFMGQGDYQFDIYRLMRQENGNNWSNYHPHTNVLWLHYLCSKLLSMKYRRHRGAKDVREELTRFYDNVLQYSSATEALQSCPMFQ